MEASVKESVPARESGGAAPCIRFANAGLTYPGPGGVGVEALQGIDLSIYEGEFLALLGPTGCGKSTLLRLVADLLSPTAGTVEVKGHAPRQARRSVELGFVFQEPALLPWRSASANIALPLESVGWDAARRRDRCKELLEMMGLAQFGDHYPHQLSGGMRQRIAIARALAWDPPILLMDEPFAALDELTRERLQDDLLRVAALTRKTILFVTHNIGEAVYLADRVVIFSERPGTINGVVSVGLARPRSEAMRDSVELLEHVRAARGKLSIREREQ